MTEALENYIIPSDNWEQQLAQAMEKDRVNYIIPSDNWEQQPEPGDYIYYDYYIIPSDNWEQQRSGTIPKHDRNYIIPSDNWEQQLGACKIYRVTIISYQAITGNNNNKVKIRNSKKLYHTKR